MSFVFLIGGIIDIGIFIYTLYFLHKVRFYPCIKEKLGVNIHLFSWAIILGGISSLHASYYAFRAIFRGFDNITESFTIVQILAWVYSFALFFTLKQQTMKNGLFKLAAFDWIKGAIVSVLVAVLTYVQQLLTDGAQVSIKMILTTSITALIGYMIKQLMTDDNGVILSMVGGRKKRKKKPNGLPQYPNMEYTFEGNDFTLQSVVTYTSDVNIEYTISVVSVWNYPNSQTVIFNELAQFTDFETLYFEIEVD